MILGESYFVRLLIGQRLVESKSSLLKKLTVRQRPRVMTFRFWQEGPGYDRNLTTPKAIMLAIDSIHNNPVRRGLCRRAVDWNWSSARHDLLPDESPNPQHPAVQNLHPSILDEGTPMSFVRHRAKHCWTSQQWHPALDSRAICVCMFGKVVNYAATMK